MIKDLQLCLLGKFLLIMRHQKYVFDHCNQSVGSYQTGNKTCQQIFFRKRISLLTGLKVSSLVRNCAFYRSELTGKWGPYGTEIKFLKFKMKYIAQRVDEKNGIIHLVMFAPRVMIIKMSKMAHFMYFLLDPTKNQSQFGKHI